jgi:hypothetical protein
MNTATIRHQRQVNLVAEISLVVALSRLGYTTWRNERTEANRNMRVAGFETLKLLGEVQTLVEYAHFKKDRQLGDPVQGWARVLYIRDLARLLPSAAQNEAERLTTAWRDNVETVESERESMVRITDEVQRLRLTILDLLAELR